MHRREFSQFWGVRGGGPKSAAMQLTWSNTWGFQFRGASCSNNSLRAKGTLISEPRFSTPCEVRFFPRDTGKGHFKEKPSEKAIFPLSRGKNRISQGLENRGSLISVPLAQTILVGTLWLVPGPTSGSCKSP